MRVINPFTVYVTIFGLTVHLVSVLLITSAFLVGLFLQKGHFIYRVLNSLILCVFGHFIFEDVIILGMMNLGEPRPEAMIYFSITFCLFASIMYLNRRIKFLSSPFYLSWYMFSLGNMVFWCLLFGFVLMIFALQSTGWFNELHLWLNGLGSDPHDLLWFSAKTLTFFTWLPLLNMEEKE